MWHCRSGGELMGNAPQAWRQQPVARSGTRRRRTFMARANGTLFEVRVAFLLCALSASAPAAEVILVADGAQGSPVVQQLRTEAVNGVRVAGGYPRVMKSEEISGLRPGRLVTVLGVCDDRKAARKVVLALKGKLALSTRTVEGEWAAFRSSQTPSTVTSLP